MVKVIILMYINTRCTMKTTTPGASIPEARSKECSLDGSLPQLHTSIIDSRTNRKIHINRYIYRHR